MRILEREGIPYVPHEYDESVTDGVSVAQLVGKSCEMTFKTLVTEGEKKTYFVFVIPVEKSLDLKKAARAAGQKSVSMLKQKELFALTGYVHGGCSPVGMKKLFPTFIDRSAKEHSTICVSAGKRGCQVEVDPVALCSSVGGVFAELTAQEDENA